MENHVLRKLVREIISEYFNNQVVYADDPTKFPYFDGLDKTPSDLDAEFDDEFSLNKDEIKEIESKNSAKEKSKTSPQKSKI